eukprot:6456372-Amphidinium_carterae.1
MYLCQEQPCDTSRTFCLHGSLWTCTSHAIAIDGQPERSHLSLNRRQSTATLRRAEQLRLQATQAFLHADQEASIRSAVNRKPVHLHHWEYSPGDPIAYYRHRGATRGAGRTLRPGWLTGTFVCFDPGQRRDRTGLLRGEGRNAWIHTGGRLIQVALEQLRPASGHEAWVPTDADWQAISHLRTAPAELPENLPPIPDEQMAFAPIEQSDEYIQDVTAQLLRSDHRVPATPTPLPSMASTALRPSDDAPRPSTRPPDPGLEEQLAPPSKQLRGLGSEALIMSSTSPGCTLAIDSEDDHWDGAQTCTCAVTAWTNTHVPHAFDFEDGLPDHHICTATRVSATADASVTHTHVRIRRQYRRKFHGKQLFEGIPRLSRSSSRQCARSTQHGSHGKSLKQWIQMRLSAF